MFLSSNRRKTAAASSAAAQAQAHEAAAGVDDIPPPPVLASPEAQFLADLLRSLQSNREAQEAELKRRQEWETSVEARYKARMAEMDVRFASLQREVELLKRALGGKEGSVATTAAAGAGAGAGAAGGSTSEGTTTRSNARRSRMAPLSPLGTAIALRPIQPMPANALQPTTFFNSTGTAPGVLATVLGKRPREAGDSSGSAAVVEGAADGGEEEQRPRQQIFTSLDAVTAGLTRYQLELWQKAKGRRKKDSRPTTIQTATRVHLLRVMGLTSDRNLPASFKEGEESFTIGSPIRWVWEKTAKQSVHNAQMRSLFLSDLQAARPLYPLVPEGDFALPILQKAFDQAFVTLRQKARSQAGLAPETEEQRLARKTVRARRANRKKAKLAHRVAARGKVEGLGDKVFDRALELGMMSSESSESEEDEDAEGEVDGEGGDEGAEEGEGKKEKTFRVRGLPWRSSRLKRLYALLDEADEKELQSRPKRGVGRKERKAGPDKEGEEALPPKGVPAWMVSKKFRAAPEGDGAEAEGQGEVELDWSKVPELGEESDVEDNDEA